MTIELSALMDGEVSAEEHEHLLKKLCNDKSLLRTWEQYHFVDFAARGECSESDLRTAFAAKTQVMRAISSESDRRLKPSTKSSAVAELIKLKISSWLGAMGLGAAIAVAASGGFIVYSGLFDEVLPTAQLQKSSITVAASTKWTSDGNEEISDKEIQKLNENLLAHSQSQSLVYAANLYAHLPQLASQDP